MSCCLPWLILALAVPLGAEDQPSGESDAARAEASMMDGLQARFRDEMSGATLVGHFTIDGQADDAESLSEERYEIRNVTRMANSDLWLFTTRIVYGDKDLTVPVPLQIKWAGKTPVITMDEITIPGMGTFSARVVIHEARYAGTWQHDDVGGHLFGRVERESDKADASAAGEPAAAR